MQVYDYIFRLEMIIYHQAKLQEYTGDLMMADHS